MTLPATAADVAAAHRRIAPYVHRTPVLTARSIDARVGARVAFKCEIFQRVGAFKARGAFNRLLQLSQAERERGVVAFSSGNHAQAVALAARELGVPATIVMPLDAPATKLAATRGYGANVLLYDRAGGESREALAQKMVEELGATPAPGIDLRPLAKRSGLGPPAELFELAEWAAWRWAGRRASFLRTASPERVVEGTVDLRRVHIAHGTAAGVTALTAAALMNRLDE